MPLELYRKNGLKACKMKRTLITLLKITVAAALLTASFIGGIYMGAFEATLRIANSGYCSIENLEKAFKKE